MTRRAEIGVMMMMTEKVFMGTRSVASLHKRSVANDAIETIATYMTSSMVEMHTAKMKAGAEIGSVKSKNSVMKGSMITMVLTVTNLTGCGTHPRRRQVILPRLEAGLMASKLQAIRDWEV
jgi:hypothetical protein